MCLPIQLHMGKLKGNRSSLLKALRDLSNLLPENQFGGKKKNSLMLKITSNVLHSCKEYYPLKGKCIK